MSGEAVKFCRKILPKVSRSFAQSIPMLDDVLHIPVTIIYLQDRLLDSFEDEISEEEITLSQRMKLMDQVVELFRPTNDNAEEIACEIKKYAEFMPQDSLKELINSAHILRQAYDQLDNFAKEISFKWLEEMNRGMKKYLTKEVKTFIDLDEYCYYVAGTVGGFLTDLLIYYSNITEKKSEILLNNFTASGQFLQKINLIRDIRDDIDNREKHYWPLSSLNISIKDLIDKKKKEGMAALSRMLEDVKDHIPNLVNYYYALPQDMPGYREFYSINNALGLATIEKMEGNPAVLYGHKPVKVAKLTFLNIMNNPEKAFKERADSYIYSNL